MLRRGIDVADPADLVAMCQELLARELGAPAVFMTTSCSAALEAAAHLLGLDSSAEVVLPSFTHPGTANAFALRGARLVFCDIRCDTLNLDESLVEQLLGPATRALVAVHYAGVPCALDELLKLCTTNRLDLVEDVAHGLLARFEGRAVGTFGRLAATSFHRTKNLSCGKGGALIVNDAALVVAAEETLDSGTDRQAFLRGEVASYSWQRVGLNATLDGALAALLLVQLQRRRAIQARREVLWRRYADALAPWAAAAGVVLPCVPEGAQGNHHIFFLRLASAALRDRFMRHMARHGVSVLTHYVPLHLSPAGRRLGYREGDLPVTEEVAATLVRLPLANDLGDDEQHRVVDAILKFPAGS